LVGRICFNPDERNLYRIYDWIASAYPGWQLSEIRNMSARQRDYWLAVIKWKREKYRVG
jgi:hypothetical protein